MPARLSEVIDIRQTVFEGNRSFEFDIPRLIGEFELHDVNACARLFQIRVKFVVHVAQADGYSELGLEAKSSDQGKRNLTNCNRVFTGLNVDVGDARWPVVD